MHHLQPDITRAGVVLPVRSDPSGRTGPTPGRARGPRWRSAGPGLFVPSGIDPGPLDQRIVEAAGGLPDGAAITGWAALGWVAPRWFDGLGIDGRTPRPVPIAIDDSAVRAPRAGVVWCHDWLFDDDIVVVDGLPITVPARSVSFEIRRLRWLVDAVQVIDMAAAGDQLSVDELATYATRIRGRPGTRLLNEALPLASENAWSPKEVHPRLVWRLETTFPDPVPNCPVFDLDGHHLVTPDLFDPLAGVAAEYDGAVHLEIGVRRRDLEREALFRDHDIEWVTMMSADLRDTSSFVARLRRAYARAARRPAGRRTWTVEQPDWWVDTSTVARRRALSAEESAVWLRRSR